MVPIQVGLEPTGEVARVEAVESQGAGGVVASLSPLAVHLDRLVTRNLVHPLPQIFNGVLSAPRRLTLSASLRRHLARARCGISPNSFRQTCDCRALSRQAKDKKPCNHLSLG